ncbi:MAG TPA: dipeptidase, partial [Gemmatimonadaceae bacterium]
MTDHITHYLATTHARHLAQLREFLSIPSISALSSHAPDVRRCAEWVVGAMRGAGLERARLIETAGNPVAYGEWMRAPGAPTVLVYGHYDVQPVDPLERWTSPPFAPTVRDGKLFARGATDDKGQLFAHLAAIEAHLRVTGRLPVNLRMVVEGEEEIGCAHVQALVRERAELLAASVVVISDTAMFARGVPSICRALRGIAYLEVEVRGAATDLHSGSFGGTVANPALALAWMLGSMKDASGRVTVPGFYDAARALGAEERAELARLPFDEARYREALGAPALVGEAGFTTLERAWTRPTLDVNGFHSGFAGEGVKTVIPSTAVAKVSMRLVPDQDPTAIGDLVERHLLEIAPPGVEVRVTGRHGGRAYEASTGHPFMRAAARAMERAFGVRPAFTREGGSNPIVSTFAEVLGAPVILFGLGLPDDNAHAPDEKIDLDQLRRGVVAVAELYGEIGGG